MSQPVTLSFTFAAPGEAAAFLVSVSNILGSATTPKADPKPETAKDPKPGKSAKTEVPAASPPPAAEKPKADTAASEKKDEKPASTAPVEYAKTGLPEKIATYLGDKTADESGYADRRNKLVALLTSFNAKKGPELKAEQFADFEAALDKLSAPGEDDLG